MEELNATMDLITRRRSSLRIDPAAPIARDLITRLCEAATWAPNHKLTEPWRFAVVTGTARVELGRHAMEAQASAGTRDPTGLRKTASKYLRAPVILVVGCASDPADPIRHREDRDAVAAGIQNLLLAATAAGLASFWATGVTARLPATLRLCRFPPDTEIVGIIYLGHPTSAESATRRRPPVIEWIGSGRRDISSQ